MITKIFLASIITYASSLLGGNFVIDQQIVSDQGTDIQNEQRIPSPFKKTESLGVEISGKSGIVVDNKSSRILFEKNSEKELPMASLTKIMTAVVLLDSGISMEDTYTVEEEAVNIYGSDIDLEIGEEILVNDLLHGLMIHSGNDAAMAIARKVGKNEESFVQMMNKKAKELGMANTQFQNPHGLDQKNHYTNVKDMVKLASYAYQKPNFKKIIRLSDYQFDAVNIPKHHQLKNTNKLLHEDYFLINGGKTGFTDNAGYCLLTFGINENKNEIITVVLGEKEDGRQFHDTKAMLEWTFGNYKWE